MDTLTREVMQPYLSSDTVPSDTQLQVMLKSDQRSETDSVRFLRHGYVGLVTTCVSNT